MRFPVNANSSVNFPVRTGEIIAVSFGLAAIGAAPALVTDDHDCHPWAQASTHAGYAGPMLGYAGQVYVSKYDPARAGYAASRELWPWYVPERGVQSLDCDMLSSACLNDERINH